MRLFLGPCTLQLSPLDGSLLGQLVVEAATVAHFLASTPLCRDVMLVFLPEVICQG